MNTVVTASAISGTHYASFNLWLIYTTVSIVGNPEKKTVMSD